MIIESWNLMIIWARVKHFSNLLQKALPIQLSSASKCIFSQKNVLSFQRCIETIRLCVMNPKFIIMNLLVGEKIKGLFFSAIQDYFDCILKVNTHFVGIEVLWRLLRLPLFSVLILRLKREDLLNREEITRKGTHLAIFFDLFRAFLVFCSWCRAFKPVWSTGGFDGVWIHLCQVLTSSIIYSFVEVVCCGSSVRFEFRHCQIDL